MPKVQQYQPDQVRTEVQQVVQPARQQDDGLQSVAKGLTDIGRMAGEMKKQADLYATEEAANMFEREKNELFFNPKTGYFNTQGRDAFETGSKVSEELQKLKERYGSQLSGQARMEFDRVANQHINRGNADIMRHSSKNLKAWEASNLQVEVENTLENASIDWNNMKQLNIHRTKGVLAVRESANAQGMSAEQANEAEENYRSAFAMSTITAATQRSAGDGEEAMRLYGDALEGPDKVKMLEAIEKKERLTKTKDMANAAVLTANNLVEKYGDRDDARTAMIEEINAIEDGELQKLVKAEATYQLNQKIAADKEEQANIVLDVQNYLAGTPSATLETYKTITGNEEKWDKLDAVTRKALENPKDRITDQVRWTEVRMMSPEEQAKLDPIAELKNYSKADYDKFVTLVANAKKAQANNIDAINKLSGMRTEAAQTKAAIEGLYGKGTMTNPANEQKVRNFYAVATNEATRLAAEKGAPLTRLEYSDMLEGITREAVLEEGKGWSAWRTDDPFFDQTGELKDIDTEKLRVASEYLLMANIPSTSESLFEAVNKGIVDIPEFDMEVTIRTLKEQGYPVTLTYIKRAHEAGKRASGQQKVTP